MVAALELQSAVPRNALCWTLMRARAAARARNKQQVAELLLGDSKGEYMKNALSACLFSFVLALPVAANAADPLVRFDGGIGVVPSRVGGVANTVRGTNPGGQPWVISRLTVDVKSDGKITVDGRGLLLGGGDTIGTNGGQSVKAKLFCGLAFHESPVVLLEPDGDFRIEGSLAPVPPFPCANPVLLIVGGLNGNWFAAGIPKR
jgi:hypothetical protein